VGLSEIDTNQGQVKDVDVLLVTVTEVETRAVIEIAEEKIGQVETVYEGDQLFYHLGYVGGAQICLVRSEMGYSGPSGSMMTVSEAIDRLSPSAVIMIGIAFGVDSEKQQIGDVLVSRSICEYEPQRVGTGSDGNRISVSRGDRVPASPMLLSRFRDGELRWDQTKVRFGLVFSGAKLIDNAAFRDRLLEIEPEAIGGEMEGVGLYSAASRKKVDWILVKAICDWADGKKNENKKKNQNLAARNAAEFTINVIARGGFSSLATSSVLSQFDDTSKKPPSDSSLEEWVVLVQDLLVPADTKSILEALKPDKPLGNPVFIHPDTSSWHEAIEYQRALVEDLLDKSRQSGYARFAIFSVAPIPLIIHLGFMLADTQTRCFKLHIDTKSWVWPSVTPADVDQDIRIHGLPQETIMKKCEVLIRVSLSAHINPQETDEIVPGLPIQIDMFVDEPGRMWLRSPKQLDVIHNAFRKVLEVVQMRVPRCNRIHLFYAGPAPIAFVIGQLINPRMTPPIQLYEYDRNKSPSYEHAVMLPL
jgi:nucleoside phosphorylase